ncbi:MAG: hypothetical protein HQ522_05915, partial [Bacteroidetes bacterium]|nr:hypothetical protein [Bacteroidota bacterium]
MDKLYNDEISTAIQKTDSFIISYPYMISFFESRNKFTVEDLIVGVHAVYGWMPTMLDIYIDNVEEDLMRGVSILNKVKSKNINDEELKCLIHLINNSLVGTSKLLHFINPEKYSIWDSRVYSYFYEKKGYHYRVNNIENYKGFMDKLNEIKEDPRFPNFHSSVNN